MLYCRSLYYGLAGFTRTLGSIYLPLDEGTNIYYVYYYRVKHHTDDNCDVYAQGVFIGGQKRNLYPARRFLNFILFA